LAFKQSALRDRELANYLNENFVCTFKQVSSFSVTTRERRYILAKDKKASDYSHKQKKGGNVASYFCDSNSRVLEIVVGPVKPNRLAFSARQAYALHQRMKDASLEAQYELARKHIADLIEDQTLQWFEKCLIEKQWNGFTRSRYNQDGNYSDKAIVEASRCTLVTAMGTRSGFQGRQPTTLEEFNLLPGLNQYGFMHLPQAKRWDSLSKAHVDDQRPMDKQLFCENLLLAELPLVRIDKIEQPVFEILMGQPYMTIDRGFAEKLANIKSTFASGKGVVIAITERVGDHRQAVVKKKIAPWGRNYLLDYRAIRKQLEHFEVFELKESELLLVMSALKLPPPKITTNRSSVEMYGPGVAVFDHDGKLRKLVGAIRGRQLVSKTMKLLTRELPTTGG